MGGLAAGELNHRCLAGAACRAAEWIRQDESGRGRKRLGAYTEKPDTLCRRCTSDVRRAVEDLPAEYVELAASIGELEHGSSGVKVSASRDLPILINARVDALMGDIADALHIAAVRVAAALNCDAPQADRRRGLNRADEVKACSAMIEPNIGKLIGSGTRDEAVWTKGESVQVTVEGRTEWRPATKLVKTTGVETALRLSDLHRMARTVLGGPSKPRSRLLIACTECGAPFLYGDGHRVECDECGTDWTADAFGLLQMEVERREAEVNEQLAAQRDDAWKRLDKLRELAAAIPEQLGGSLLKPEQVADLLTAIVGDHPTPAERENEEVTG